MTSRAALFNVDGTLVDSNYLHVEAWSRAFAELGPEIDAWRIHRSLGIGPARMLEALLGDRAERYAADAVRSHAGHFAELAPRLRAFDGAAELLDVLASRGATVVLATAAEPADLPRLRRLVGAAKSVAMVSVAPSAESAASAAGGMDAAQVDIVQVALTRSRLPAADAVMVGNTLWDVAAASRAGVRCIGVQAGGVSAGELLDSGAAAVYADVRALLDGLDASILA